MNNVIYKKILTFDNIDFYNIGKNNYRADIKLELRDIGENKIEFSGVAYIYEHKHKQPDCIGQCIDKVAQALPDNKKLQRINEIWKKFHLNSFHAGCIHQRHLEGKPYDEVKGNHCDICNYTYGHGWQYEPIPQDIIDEIKGF